MKQHIDLNSGMGEGFGPWLIGDGEYDEIMPPISSYGGTLAVPPNAVT